MSKLNGFKTYIIAGVTIAYALIQAWQAGGFDQTELTMILAALGGASLRHGISTSS